MKVHLLLLAALTGLVAYPASRLSFPPEGVAFGEIAVGKEISKSIEIRNDSSSTVVISHVKGCCGADVELSPMDIEPNAVATLSVVLKQVVAGEFSKQVRIFCDDPECPMVSVPVSGVAVGEAGADLHATSHCETVVAPCAIAMVCVGAACLFWKVRKCLSLASVLVALARVCIGGVFVYAGAMKFCDLSSFEKLISRYDLLPGFATGIAAVAFPVAECVAGLMLVFSRWVRASAMAISAMLVVFIVALSQAAVRGLDVSCGCFGGVAPSSLVWAIVRDIVMLVPSVLLGNNAVKR